MDRLLENHVALVSGAAQGNGAAIAKGLAMAGAAVAVSDINLEGAKETALVIERHGSRSVAFKCDVADRDQCNAFIKEAEEVLGKPSILVNNAGIFIRGGMDEHDFENVWRQTLNINVMGVVNMTMAALPSLRQTRGRIINVGSIRSFTADKASAAYAASKGAILQITKSFAVELVGEGVRVNAIAPGIIATPMTEVTRADPLKIGNFLRDVPMGRVGEAEELVGPVNFLASDMSSYITGVMLPVDGGYLAQ